MKIFMGDSGSLFLGFIGATSVLAFSPFNFKPIIVISLSIFVAAIINSENFWSPNCFANGENRRSEDFSLITSMSDPSM